MGRAKYVVLQTGATLLLLGSLVVPIALETGIVHAIPSPGGDTTTLAADCSSASAIDENAATPEPDDPNVCLVVPTLENDGGSTPNSVRILSVSGGSLLQSNAGALTLGASGTILSLSGNDLILNFTPSANNTTASFTYAIVNPDNTSQNSNPSTATVPITPVDVAPELQTTNGTTGTGLAGTYYRTSKDLTTVPDDNDDPGNPTEPAITRLDPQVNFDTDVNTSTLQTMWGIPDVDPNDFSVRWTGDIKAPVDGTYNICANTDDGGRVWIDGTLVVDNYGTHAPEDVCSSGLSWTAGTQHSVEMDYYERGGGEEAQLLWQYTSGSGDQSQELIPTVDLFPGIIRPDLTYVVGQPAAVVDDALGLSDVDSPDMASATVTISTNCQPSEDELQFTNQNGIVGSYNASTCTLTLNGSASIADYQAAIRSVKYYDSEASPDTDSRTVQFSVNDGQKDSNDTFRNIDFSSEDSPPVISEGNSVTVDMDEDSSPTPFALTLDATDADNQSISWSVATAPAHGMASVGEPSNSTAITYTPNTHYTGTDSFVVQASDGDGGTDETTVHVVVAPHADTDGVSTTIEDAAPNGGDANNDGIPDSEQNNVTSLVDSATGSYASVAVPSSCSLSDVSVDTQASLADDSGYSYPLGLLNFTTECSGAPGFTTTITQYYYNPPNDNFVLRKFVNGTFQTIPNATFTRTTIGGEPVLEISYQVTDGGPLDADGVANGVIVDPAGPAVADPSLPAPDTGYGEPSRSTVAGTVLLVGTAISGATGLLLLFGQRKRDS